MKRPFLSGTRLEVQPCLVPMLCVGTRKRVAGYTLIEILLATSLSLILLSAIIAMFGKVGESVSESRSMLEAADRLRLAEARLQMDLAGITVTMMPPRRPESNEGYCEIIEGPVGVGIWPNAAGIYNVYRNQLMQPSTIAQNSSGATTPPNNPPDTTVGDFDDILMFTTRSSSRPFVGKYGGNTIQSDVAEVAWFVRGRTLHRRVLLVAPGTNLVGIAAAGFYANYDISARLRNGVMVANSLSDLTRRENRFAHASPNAFLAAGGCEFWAWTISGGGAYLFPFPTLPTLNECSTPGWSTEAAGTIMQTTLLESVAPDFWSNDPTRLVADNAFVSPNTGSRVSDDIILTNVIGFDVKVWDPHVVVNEYDQNGNLVAQYSPGQPNYSLAYSRIGLPQGNNHTYSFSPDSPGAYVDLGYAADGSPYNGYFSSTDPASPKVSNSFGHVGAANSGLSPPALYRARVYDTYSTSHENPLGHDGLDNDYKNVANGVVDDDLEKTFGPNGPGLPPYPTPLRGIQVKIRVFEPDSRQIREVTVKQDFLPQ